MIWWLIFVALATERIEIDVGPKDSAQVVSAGSEGVVVYVSRAGAKKSYEIYGYDTDLKPTWTNTHRLGRKMLQSAYANDDNYTWTLLQRDTKSVDVLRTDIQSGETLQIPIPMGKRYAGRGKIEADGQGGAWVVTNGRKHSNLAWISPEGQADNSEVYKKTRIVDLSANDGGLQAATLPWWRDRSSPLTLLDLGNGQVAGKRQVVGQDDSILLDGRALNIAGNDWVVGTYQPAGAWFAGSQGMYVATFDDDAQRSFTQHAFGDFDGFLDWLPDRRQARVEGRVDKKKSKGRTPKIRMNLLFSDAISTDEGGVVVAENYYAVYYTYTTTSTDAQGNRVTQTHTVFLGYRFTHAMIAAFGPNGERLWDHSVPLDRRLTGVVKPHVRLAQDGNDLTVVYPYQKVLHKAVFHDGIWSGSGQKINHAEVGGDEADKHLFGDVTWWHDDQFLAWGIDKKRGLGNKERVFWLSGLSAAESR